MVREKRGEIDAEGRWEIVDHLILAKVLVECSHRVLNVSGRNTEESPVNSDL